MADDEAGTGGPETDDRRRVAWEAASSVPLVALSLVFIAAYSVRVIDTGLPAEAVVTLNVVIAAIWVVFAIDYAVRWALARHRTAFVRSSLFDLLSVVVPVFRPFVLLRGIGAIPLLRNGTGSAVRRRLVVQSTLFVVLFVYSISLAVLAAERGAPGASILTFGDAVWWACVTVATVGYGDYYPVTVLGRILAVMLMIGGVAIVGVATATIVSYLGETIGRQRRPHDGARDHDHDRDRPTS